MEKIDINDFDAVFDIMEQSFPDDEYRSYNEQKSLFNNTEYSIYVFRDDNGGLIKAFISIWEFESFVYVEHFAVNPVYRNCGLGGKMLKELKDLFNKIICLEVELPDEEMPKRRIRFYERNNFCLNEYPYIQPPISKGKNEVPLLIMSSRRKINIDEFEEIKKMLYNKVYNVKY